MVTPLKHHAVDVRGDLLAGRGGGAGAFDSRSHCPFPLIAGVDPKSRACTPSFCIAVIIGLCRRPAQAMDLRGPLAPNWRLASWFTLGKRTRAWNTDGQLTLLTGLIQTCSRLLKAGQGLMRFVSRSVVTGFVNALAILIIHGPAARTDQTLPGTYTRRAERRLAGHHLFVSPLYTGNWARCCVAVGLHCGAERCLRSSLISTLRNRRDMGDCRNTLPIFPMARCGPLIFEP